ncbi:MAG TPA: sigma-70 family RNA polymerase sigma factor [Bacteroidota bacterium]|nr:sigma-70 family RNA polymerase sigma factor [Bacteroidota bacterium]
MQKTDATIVREILAGDKRAFGEIIDRHKDKAMTLAVRMLRNREDAEEAIQDAFVRAFKALPRFEWKSSFSTWLYRIVYNVCSTRLSRRDEESHTRLDLDDEAAVMLVSDELPPDIRYETEEIENIIRAEIDQLPPVYSAICTLFFVQDMSYDQIVEVTGIPLGTVKVRLFRSRLMLRDAVVRKIGPRPIVSEKIRQEE